MRKLGDTAIKLRDTQEQYPTIKAAAEALGVSTARISALCKKLGITRWSNKPRPPSTAAKPIIKVCKQCQIEFPVSRSIKRPGDFCGDRCKGIYAGKHYGFGKNKEV
jgi:hypothetical protein